MKKSFTFDAKKGKFKASTNAEKQFYKALKKVAEASGHIVDSYSEGANLRAPKEMQKALEEYAKRLGPWAVRQSTKLLEQVQKSNSRAYKNKSKTMSEELKSGKAEAASRVVALSLLNEQVALIQSIPIEAGLRAQRIAAQNFVNGTRAMPDPEVVDRLKEEMRMSTSVAVNRAKLIARTETARANASFVEARATSLGVTHYIWRTTMDGAERRAHKMMNGKRIRYDEPPVLPDGTIGHAGTFPNCRCYQDPVLPEE